MSSIHQKNLINPEEKASPILKTVFENNELVIVDKPAGYLSVPSRDQSDRRPIVGLLLQEQLKTKIFPLHRLDFEVSGILIFAKNAKTHKELQEFFEKRAIKKTYHAITHLPALQWIPENMRHIYREADPPLKEGQFYEWNCKLEKGKRRSFEAEFGKESVTQARVIKVNLDTIYWELYPLTGRSHQLRYELFRHGCPIVGDSLYGSIGDSLYGCLQKSEIDSEKPLENKIYLRHVGIEIPEKFIGNSHNLPKNIQVEGLF